MRKFFASCLGFMAAFLVLFIAGITILVFLVKSGNRAEITDNTILQIPLEGSIQEQVADDPFSGIFASGNKKVRGLDEIKEVLDHAKNDDHIKGIHLDLGNLKAGMVVIEELRQYLADFKKSKKWVIAHATHLSLGSYYLATAADKIYLNPEGEVTFNGLSVYVMFYKKMLDKLKIKTNVFRVGAYKSAVEPFIRNDLSDESRTQLQSLLQSIEGNMLARIATARNITEKRLKVLSDSAKIQTTYNALTSGLIDASLYHDELEAKLKARLNLGEDDDINTINYDAYLKTVSEQDSNGEKDRIAVIVAEGGIVDGKSDPDRHEVGATSIVKAVDKAYKNDDVKAIVVRINSPGGEFVASDKMWRAIKRAAGKKPVIASMSNYAASGGYYIASACDTIIAQPNTITGSIGVFGLMFDASEFLENKIGITGEEVKTGLLGKIRMTAPMSNLAKSIWQSRIDSTYETFIGKVALSRNDMTVEQVRNVAGGRVWTGSQAKENGLVDVLGNYGDALRIAAEKAGIKKYTINYYNKPDGMLERFMKKVSSVKAGMVVQTGVTYMLYRQWQHVEALQGIQARMPFERIEEATEPLVQLRSEP